MRLQEFYESPHAVIKDKHFTWENFIDCYTKQGCISYWKDWQGFNVPGDICIKFFYTFKNELTEKEKALWKTLLPIIRKHQYDFYLIGVYKEGDIIHEEAHGLFYLNAQYKAEMIKLINTFSKRYFNQLCQGLTKRGYCPQVFMDEIQAYAIDKKQRKFLNIFKKYRS